MSSEFSRHDQAPRELDFRDVWQAIVAARRGIIITTAVLAGLAALYVAVATPRYTSDARVLVENQEGAFTRTDRTETSPDEFAVASQVQVITSRDVARQAVRRLNLSGNPEFDPTAGAGGLMRQIVGLIAGSRTSTREERIFEEYYRRLSVYAVPKSRVLVIEFQSRDPALAARGANVIAEIYIEMQANAKRDHARGAAQALGGQVTLMRTRVSEAEGKVEAFRSQSGLMVGANNSLLPTQQLAEINAQLAAARTAQADSQARARLLREALRNGRLNEVPDIANNELVRRVSEQRVTLRSQLALESRTLGPEHPRTKDLVAQIFAVEGELRSAAEKAARTLENDGRIAGSRVEFLLAAVERQKRAVGGSGDDEVRLRELEREAKLLREQLETSTQRWQEAMAREASSATPADARVISRAIEPEKPTSPKPIIILFAALGGLAISMFAVVAKVMIAGPPGHAPQAAVVTAAPVVTPRPVQAEATAENAGMANRIQRALGRFGSPASAQAWAGPGLAPTAPALAHGGYAARAYANDSSGLDPLDQLVGAILQAPAGPEGSVTLVCSANVKTAFDAATGLSRALTRGGRCVMVELSKGTSLAPGDGLSEILDGVTTFARALQRDSHSRLHIIGRGHDPVDAGAELESVLAALVRTYDFVVLAAGGDEGVDLALSLAAIADRCVVGRRAVAGADSAEALADALAESGAGHVEFLDVPLAAAAARNRFAGAAA